MENKVQVRWTLRVCYCRVNFDIRNDDKALPVALLALNLSSLRIGFDVFFGKVLVL